jgi:hypothetical protein
MCIEIEADVGRSRAPMICSSTWSLRPASAGSPSPNRSASSFSTVLRCLASSMWIGSRMFCPRKLRPEVKLSNHLSGSSPARRRISAVDSVTGFLTVLPFVTGYSFSDIW